MLTYIGLDPKITSLVETMYDNVERAVVISYQLTEWFRVRQGCLSPISLFLGVRHDRHKELIMQGIQPQR